MSNGTLYTAREVIQAEIAAIEAMLARLGTSFEGAVQALVEMRGRVVVMGMGKSGIIGQKIAATLASTGTPAFSVHPGEAYHGDLGMIKPVDVALLISNSGETDEVIRLIPFLQHQGNIIIAMTGNADSTLGRNAQTVLDVGVTREACAINLAPTSSTTCALIMGDALAVAISTFRGFQPEDFARFHPGGRLGRKLLTRVCDVMQKENLPICSINEKFRDIVHIINRGRLGLAVVMVDDCIAGIITDGDVRRAFDRTDSIHNIYAADIMNTKPRTVRPEIKVSDAEALMHESKISSLIVCEATSKILGVLNIFNIK